MSNICPISMENTHNNVEFGVIQKTSKQSLISIFFYIGRGDTPPPPLPYPPPLGISSLDQGLRPCLHKPYPPPPWTRNAQGRIIIHGGLARNTQGSIILHGGLARNAQGSIIQNPKIKECTYWSGFRLNSQGSTIQNSGSLRVAHKINSSMAREMSLFRTYQNLAI